MTLRWEYVDLERHCLWLPDGKTGRKAVYLNGPAIEVLGQIERLPENLGAAVGLSLPLIGKMLGHTQAATTQRYAHLAADPVLQASEQIGERLAAVMAGESAAGSESVN